MQEILFFLIEENDCAALQAILENGRFDDSIRACVDAYIEHAIAHASLEAQLMLTSYKAEKIGYDENGDRLKL